MNILYVEDNPYDAELLIRTFSNCAKQLQVEWVETIAGAKARLQNESPNHLAIYLVLTDMQLPDGNGISIPAYLQENRIELPVVVLTGAGSEEGAVSALKAGASDYVVKDGDYAQRMPAIIESAWQHFHEEVERHMRPLHVLYAERSALDIDLTRRHFTRYAPYIQLGCVTLASEVLTKFHKAATDQPMAERPCDVLLLDYHLQGMNGLELMKELLVGQKLELPIILITGHGDEEIALQSLRLGAMDYIVKNEGYLYKLPIVIENAYYRAELAHEQYLMHTLMDNTPLSIYFKDTQSRFIRISRSMASVFGLEGSDQAVGKTDFDFFNMEHARKAFQDEQEIIRTGLPLLSLEEHEVWPERPSRWMLTTKMPLRDQAGKITGTFGISQDITGRRQAELALQESEARYRRLFEDAVLGIFQSTPEGKMITVNPAYARMFGFDSPEEVVSAVNDVAHDLYVHPAHRAEMIRLVSENPDQNSFENLYRRKDGSIFLGNVHFQLVKDDLGNVRHLEGFIEDITARKQREREVQAIAALSKAMRATRTRAEMLPIILDQVVDLLDADLADLEMVDPATGDALVELATGTWTSMLGMRIARDRGLNSYIHETHKPYTNDHVGEDPRILDPALYEESQALAGAPLLADGQIIGFIWFGRRARIEPSDVRLLAAIADIAANAINRVTLHEKTERSMQRLAALHDIDMAISSDLDLNATLDILLGKVIDQLHVDAADIFLLAEDGFELYYAAGKGFHSALIENTRLEVEESLAGKAVLVHEITQIPDLSKVVPDIKLRQALIDEKIVAYYATSLVAKGWVTGVLEVFHRTPLAPDGEWLNFLDVLAGQAAIAIDEAELFQDIKHSNYELARAYDETIEGWSHALDLRDKETEGHTQRVAEMTLMLARAMHVPENDLVWFRRGALLHDIGKMGIPDSILLKAGRLSPEEWEIMRCHPRYAYDMLSNIDYLRRALDIPYCHHEKWDGSGYPRQLKGEEIPLSARIFAVVDVWDALTSNRPYRPAWTNDQAIEYIRTQSGLHFEPRVADVFLKTVLGL